MSDVKYPLMQHAPDNLKALSGRSLSEITLDAVAEGILSPADMRIQAETLRLQAQVAVEAGYTQLAANLRRAAELTAVPNKEVLQIYDLLRPGRASYEQLIQLVEHLEQTYQAVETAKFVRDAAGVYKQRNLLR
jgi:propanediol dehydratase small subunit